jgi:transposase
VAAVADARLRARPAQLRDALGAGPELNPVYRRLLKMALQELQLSEEQIGPLDQERANLPLTPPHQDAVRRLADPGLGADSAPQILAEVDATSGDLSFRQGSLLVGGACPGDEESAGVNHNQRSPRGNRHMGHILNPAANAAVKRKGSIFEIAYRRLKPPWDTDKLPERLPLGFVG